MIHLCIFDPHAHFEHNNKRANLFGKLIADIKPDKVLIPGDLWDMPSLASFDKGTRAAMGRTYRADVDAGLDFNERLWHEVRKNKKRMPEKYFFEGNHEYRIKKSINLQPELENTISFNDLQTDRFFDHVVEYNGRSPGVMEVDGINYAHFFISGVMGKSIGGIHPAYSILQKCYASCSAGDLHLLSYSVQTGANGKRIQGLVGGCAMDYDANWAGEANKLWWRGVVVKRNVENGNYDPQFISLEAIKKAYG